MLSAKFNSIFRAAALTAAVAIALPAFAQAAQTRVNIPFAFELGDDVMPAGHYMFERQHGSWILYVTDPSDVKRAFTTVPTGDNQTPFTGKLVFMRTGQTYRLAELHLTGAPSGMNIPATREQIEFAKRNPPVRVEVALVRK